MCSSGFFFCFLALRGWTRDELAAAPVRHPDARVVVSPRLPEQARRRARRLHERHAGRRVGRTMLSLARSRFRAARNAILARGRIVRRSRRCLRGRGFGAARECGALRSHGRRASAPRRLRTARVRGPGHQRRRNGPCWNFLARRTRAETARLRGHERTFSRPDDASTRTASRCAAITVQESLRRRHTGANRSATAPPTIALCGRCARSPNLRPCQTVNTLGDRMGVSVQQWHCQHSCCAEAEREVMYLVERFVCQYWFVSSGDARPPHQQTSGLY